MEALAREAVLRGYATLSEHVLVERPQDIGPRDRADDFSSFHDRNKALIVLDHGFLYLRQECFGGDGCSIRGGEIEAAALSESVEKGLFDYLARYDAFVIAVFQDRQHIDTVTGHHVFGFLHPAFSGDYHDRLRHNINRQLHRPDILVQRGDQPVFSYFEWDIFDCRRSCRRM